ncbi:MAG: fructose-bisphosphate aldolase [Nanoarchaeota archaeon]
MKINLNKITTKGKALYLAYDQGLEHGPIEFNDKNVDPLYILNIAKKGKYNGIIFQKGIAEKYHKEIIKSKVPLILKLNGKTKLLKGEPLSAQIATVADAIRLKAKAVGFTIYIGSKYEEQMIEEFSKIEREAHAKGLPVIVWIYPRGKSVKNDTSKENLAYSARTALELGADIAKIKYGGKPNDLAWAVKSAGRTKVVIAGGIKTSENAFLKQARDIMSSGASGLAIGRNVWKSKNPLELTKKIKKIIWK